MYLGYVFLRDTRGRFPQKRQNALDSFICVYPALEMQNAGVIKHTKRRSVSACCQITDTIAVFSIRT